MVGMSDQLPAELKSAIRGKINLGPETEHKKKPQGIRKHVDKARCPPDAVGILGC